MSVGRRICVESRNAQLSKMIRFPPARLNIKIQFVCEIVLSFASNANLHLDTSPAAAETKESRNE